MSDLDQVKGLIARGDKEKAVVQVAKLLIENKRDVDAWLLLGEIIEDPSKKKDCYQWVLRLSPNHVVALTKLQELESQPSDSQLANAKETEISTKRSSNKPRRNLNYVPNLNLTPAGNKSNDDTEIMGYFIVGVVAFFVILYIIVTGTFSNNIFCGGLLFLFLSAGIIILLVINKNRG